MKKIFILLILLTILLLNSYTTKPDFSFSNYFNVGTLTQYTDENMKNLKYKKSILGESIYFTNLNVENALNKLKAKIQFTEYIANKDLSILYCTSPLINKNVKVKNKSVNLQIAITEEYVVIGWPLILGSF